MDLFNFHGNPISKLWALHGCCPRAMLSNPVVFRELVIIRPGMKPLVIAHRVIELTNFVAKRVSYELANPEMVPLIRPLIPGGMAGDRVILVCVDGIARAFPYRAAHE